MAGILHAATRPSRGKASHFIATQADDRREGEQRTDNLSSVGRRPDGRLGPIGFGSPSRALRNGRGPRQPSRGRQPGQAKPPGGPLYALRMNDELPDAKT